MKETIKRLQKELGIFLLSLAIATTLVVVSMLYWESAFEDKQMSKNNLAGAKEKYYLAIDRKRLLKEFESEYNKLIKEGVVGDEHRLNWIDIVEQTTKKEKIPYVKYKINKQATATESELGALYPGIDIFKSSMMLDMQLLHEGDLYTVINKLNDNAKGLFNVESCNLMRNQYTSGSVLENKTDKNFTAKCSLVWYTMREKTAPALVSQEDE